MLVTKELSSAGLVAAVGDATNAVVGAGSVIAGAPDEVAAGLTSMTAGATSEAKRALLVGAADAVVVEDSFVEDAFALDAFVVDAFALEVEAAESEADAGVDADEGTPRPSAAKADGDNNAKNMAATATLTSSPPDVS